jgi:DNA repair protein RadC
MNRDYRLDLSPRHLREVVNEFVAFSAKTFLIIAGHPIPAG